MSAIDKKIKVLEEQLAAENETWKQAEEQLKAQFNMSYGAHLGRVRTLTETLELLKKTEDDEDSLGNTENDNAEASQSGDSGVESN